MHKIIAVGTGWTLNADVIVEGLLRNASTHQSHLCLRFGGCADRVSVDGEIISG